MMGSNYVSCFTLLMALVIGLLHQAAKGEKSCDDPCEKAFCARYPMADCRRNLGDKCKAEFFYDPKKPIADCFNGGVCVEECPRHLNPLCGSDGKTYGNECTFAAGKCKSNGNLTLKHRGPCGLDDAGEKSCDDPCEKAFCARYPMADCRRNLSDKCKAEFFYDPKKPIADCFNSGECVEDCPRDLNPLCGSDGKTYGNECLFAAGKCKSNGALVLSHRGPCV